MGCLCVVLPVRRILLTGKNASENYGDGDDGDGHGHGLSLFMNDHG